ncbi:MAG: hypothetical protein ACREXT_06330 [Gammaproteobacteria bacterium]
MGFDALKRWKITRVANSAVAAQTAVDSSIVDMQGYDGVLFLAALGDVTLNSVLTLTAQQNVINSATGMAAIGNTVARTAGATDSDNGLLVLDVRKPRERYVRVSLTRTAANAVVDGIFALQYGAGNMPTTHDASVLVTALLTSPSE